MLFKNEWCIKMYMHEEATLRTSFTQELISVLLPPPYISGTKQPEHS